MESDPQRRSVAEQREDIAAEPSRDTVHFWCRFRHDGLASLSAAAERRSMSQQDDGKDTLRLTFEDEGKSFELNLDADEAESMALNLLSFVGAKRPVAAKPLAEQTPMMTIQSPRVEFGRSGAGTIIMAVASSDQRPIWSLLKDEHARRIRDDLDEVLCSSAGYPGTSN